MRCLVLITDKYKKLIRLYIAEEALVKGQACALNENQAHYLRNVMRKAPGDQIRVFNGKDGEFLAELEVVKKRSAMIILKEQLLEQKNSGNVWVVASPIKKTNFDLMVEKSSELGASKFVPAIFEHTVVHKVKLERLEAIAIEAAEQSERLYVMEVCDIQRDVVQFIKDNQNIKFLFCVERSLEKSILKVLSDIGSNDVAVIIGPEGGFSDKEISNISALDNCYPVSLGGNVLRSETAMISALSAINLLPA